MREEIGESNGVINGQRGVPCTSNTTVPSAAPFAPISDGPLLRHNVGPFDVDKYLDGLKDSDISDEEKREFLQALCLIMKTFVDIGWGVNSVQRVVQPFMGLSDEFASTSEGIAARVEATEPFNEMAARKDDEV